MNSVLINNHANYETLAVIKELQKLGIIKSSKPKPKRSPQMIEDIKQESDMVSSATYGTQMRNIPPIQQITAGMTQDQIEDIQRTQAAQFAALRNEVQQNRIDDLYRTGNALFSIMNPKNQNFRDSTTPSPSFFPTNKPDVILLGNEIPDTQEERFTQTLNEGGPEATEEIQTDVFPPEETEVIEISPPRIQPQQKIASAAAVASAAKKPKFTITKQEAADELGLGKIPTMKNSYAAVEDYYIALTDLGIGERDASFNSKSQILAEINKLLEERRL